LTMNIFSKVTIPRGVWHITCRNTNQFINKKIIYNFDNNNAFTTNWENIEPQALELTTKKTLTYGWINFLMQILGFLHKILLIILEWNHITFVVNILLTHV
jgi:hypothetical protein